MTTDLEKQFFDTFGIEPKTNQVYGMQLDYHIEDYPQITDRILLELICILVKFQKDNNSYLKILSTTKDDIKAEILDMLIHREFALKHQVQALFKEER